MRGRHGYIARVRGVPTTPEHLLITSGLTQVVVLVARVLRGGRYDGIAVGDPSFAFHRDTIVNASLRPVPVPVDDGLPSTVRSTPMPNPGPMRYT